MPWLAAAGGLALGWATHGNSAAESGDATSSPPDHVGNRAGQETRSPVPGSTGHQFREIASLDAAGCEALLKELGSAPETRRGITAEAIFLHWMSLTSAAQVLATASKPDREWMIRFRAPLFNAWVTLDPAAAMDASAHPEFAQLRTLQAIAEGRPDFGEFVAKSWSDSSSWDPGLRRALTRLATEQPEIARNLPDTPPGIRTWGVAAVARGWAKSDPQATLAWLRGMDPGSEATTAGIAALFATWSEMDPVTARKALAEEKWLGNRSFGIAMESLRAPDQPKSAIQLALQSDPFLGVTGLHRLLADRGFDWAAARAIDDFEQHNPFETFGWKPADPAQASREAADLPPGPARDYLMETLLNQWSARDTDAVVAFASEHGIESRTIDSLRARPTPAMIEAAIANPDETFAVVFDPGAEPIAGMNREQAMRLLHHWWFEEPQEAADLIANRWHPDLKADEEASVQLSSILGISWAQRDPIAASQWAASLPEGDFREFAWESMANFLGGYAPDLAFSLSTQLTRDPKQREQRLKEDLWEINKQIGHEAALHLLENSPLSDEERESLRQSLNPPFDR